MSRRKTSALLENVQIIGIADKGRALGRTPEGMAVFIEGAVPGDVVNVQTTRKKKGLAEGYVKSFVQLSTERTEPFCTHFGVCGGCKWQNLNYEAQLFHKEKVVRDAFQHLAKVPVEQWHPIVGSNETRLYRNKLEFAFSNRRWRTIEEMDAGVSDRDGLGFHRPGAFDKVVHVDECFLQAEPCNAIRNRIYKFAQEKELSFYNIRGNEGFLRNVVIRVTTLGQTMVIMSLGHDDPEARTALFDHLIENEPITTLIYTINQKVNDTILDLDMVVYHGPGYIEEQLGHVRFRIGPKSFFQTNTRQGVRLYEIAAEFAGLTGTENVYDLYTGLGSIALFLAHKAGKVVGIEEVAPAIEDAKVNAKLNGIENCTFYAGDVRNILTDAFAAKHGRPDVLITDPPRNGMHPDVVQMLVKLAAPKLVYVSCNPATQARDLQILGLYYHVRRVQPVDMFPHTHHIENVALLELK